MFIETVPNRTSPPAVLLRESYRDEQGRAQKRTLANLSKVPADLIAGLKALLKGGMVIGTRPEEMQIERSLPHGHVAAALGTLREIALDRLMLSTAKDAASRRHCELVVAMIVDRLIAPRSKLGFVRAVDEETATTSLGAVLRLGAVQEREAYAALDWLLTQQQRIENGLAGSPRTCSWGAPGAAAPARWRAGALRRQLIVFRGPLLPVGAIRLQPRSPG